MALILMFTMVLLSVSFCKNYYHFMNILLILECFVLLVFFFLNFFQELFYLVFFCVLSVCEGALGLSLMMTMIRCSGSDFCSMKFLSC